MPKNAPSVSVHIMDICDIENSTNISRIVSAGDGEVDDVLVGGGQQGDEEEAEDEQDPPKAGIRPVAHFGNKFTSTAWACHPGKAMTRLMF